MERAIRILVGVVVVSVVAHLAATSALAGVSFDREGETLKSFTVDCGTGKLSMKRALWTNTTVLTESGKEMKLVDPFMYQTLIGAEEGHIGGYWSEPELWDLWRIERLDVPERPDTDIVRITAEQVGVKKEVTIALEKGRNVAYVFNRITALKEVDLQGERQCIYISKTKRHRFYVDGGELIPEDRKRVSIHRWFMVHQPAEDVSAAVVFMVQDYPGSRRSPFGRIAFRIDEKKDGADVGWWKGSGIMAAGSSRTQQYIIMWGDGDLREEVEALSKQTLAGELNSKVHVLP